MAIASTNSDMSPTLCDGKRWSIGNRNPVTLVNTVVVRKIAVQPSSRLPLRSPYSTTNPEPIPARLMITCSRVNVEVVMPRIMMRLLPGKKDATRCHGDTLLILAFDHWHGSLSEDGTGLCSKAPDVPCPRNSDRRRMYSPSDCHPNRGLQSSRLSS